LINAGKGLMKFQSDDGGRTTEDGSWRRATPSSVVCPPSSGSLHRLFSFHCDCAGLRRGDLPISDTLVTTGIPVGESPCILPRAQEEIAGARDGTWPLEAAPAAAAGLVGRAARTGLMLSVHSELAPIEREWRAFERTAALTAFQSFDWLARWQRHIGSRQGTRPVVVFGRTLEGDLLFILPLALERRYLVRRLCWLGGDL